jgi:hypothetical protein
MQRLSYSEAHGPFDGNSIRRLLGNIAAGRYWKVSEDFQDGSQFDPPELQAKKAKVVLQELDAQIAKLDDADPLDKQAHIMLLMLQAETRFDDSVTKITERQENQEQPKADNPPEIDESELSGEEKLTRAKEFASRLR